MKKWFLLSRKKLAVLGCVLAAAVMLGVVNYPAVMASASTRQLPIYCVQRDQKAISISFDAAWGNVILRQRYITRPSFLLLPRPAQKDQAGAKKISGEYSPEIFSQYVQMDFICPPKCCII